jgi:DNA repair exonuclease SbcCD ATPase subunit
MSKINHFDYIRWEMELSIRKIQKGGKRFMAVNDFIVNLVAGLSKTKSKQQIKSDAKSLGDMYVKLIGNLDMSKTRKAIKAQLKGLNNLTFNITPNVNTKGVQSATKQAINNAQRVANNNKVHLNFDTSKQQLVNQIKILGRNNNKLFNNHEMTAKYNQLLNAANVAKSTGELKTLRGELSAFKTELVATNNAGMTWGSKFKESVKSYTKFFSGASLVYAISNQVRNAATEAKTLDDSLVNLQKVTDEISDRDALYKYFDKSLSKAQELNVKVGSLIDAVTELKKLGWDLDDAELGAKWANILSNVGDVDIDTAIGSIKTSIASFDEIGGYGNDQMDKKLEAYTDLINNMSNKYSIDAEGLAESIRLSAGTLTEAHMSIEQAATMFATANKYYNDPSYLGNTAKIGSLRMRASSGDTDAIEELQEMGEEVDDLATATSNLREKLMALTGVDIMEDEHTFKSYYDQLYEISQVMDKLDDTSRANVLETMFGKSRSAAGAAILSGMKESASAYEDAINSAGSATEEYQTWMTSADAACQRFSNTLTETYQSIINGNTVRDLANLGSAVLEFANNWGIVEGTLKGVIALNLGKFIATGGMALITATKQVEQYGKALQMASNVPNGNLSARFQALKSIAQATSTLTTEQLRNVLATNTLTQADRVRILQMQGMTKEMALQKLAEMNLTQATNAQTAANTTSTASTFSLKAAMTGLGATLKSVFLSNPVGIVLMGISLGVSAVTSAVSKHNQAVEEARQKAKEAADAANTLGDEIATLANKYIQLSDAVKTDASAKEDLMTTQTELLKKLGLEGESIDDLIAKYGSLSNAIKQASIDSLKNQQTDLIAGVNAAKEELMDVAKDNFWGTNNIISASGEEAVKAFKELEKAGVIDSGSYGTGGGQLVLIGDDTVEGALENYKKLEDAVNALRDSEAFTADELSDNSLFNSIYSRYSEMKESVEAYNSSIDNLNENLAQQTMLTALQGNELPKTEEDFNKFKQELIDTAVASEQFIGNEKEITDAINNYLSTVPEFEGYYSIPLENELDKVDELLNQEDFSKTFTGTLAQVQALSEGLDQLDKIYADVYDKEDFDWSSILNNEDFKKQFGELGSVYDDFIKTIANSPSDLGACQSAFNKLTTEYINNSDVMKNLTEDTKAGTVAMLEQMGVANAEEMVEARLAAQKYATANGCIDLANATWEEISALIAEGNASQETQQYLANLALSKIDINNIKLDTKADVDNIIAIANAAGASAAQIAALKTALASLSNAKIDKWANSGGGMNSLNLLNPGKLNTPSSGNSKIDQFAKQQQAQKTKDAVQDATDTLAKTLDDIKNGAYNLDASNFYANYSGGSATSKAVNDAAKAAKDAAKDVKEAVAETFDFIENGINRFDKAFSKLEDKVDKTSSSFTSRLNAYKEALNAATFGIELLTDDYNKYMQKANEVGLNEDIASAVRGGASNIWDYSDDTVKQQIKDYQSWYDKAQDCLDKIDELKDKQLELTQASIELLITQYEKLSTKVENANDRMEKWISLKESWGFSANTKNYDSMNKNIQKQIDFIIKQDEQLKLLQKTVTKGSEAWYEYNERIDSNKASLIDLKQQMQENATAAAELAKATADKKTEKYDSQDELYDAKIDNATSAKTKNKLINKKISNITKRQNIYNSVVTTDNKNLKSAKKTIGKFKSTKENKKVLASIKKAAKADKRISQSLLDKASKLNDNGKLYNACVQYNAYWDAKQSDKATADLYKETAKQDKADLAKEKFDNISSDYDNKISSNEQKKTALNNKISLAQEQGKQISAAYYKSLISSEKGEKNKLIKERKDLQKSLNDAVIKGSIKKGSDEWHEMVSAINEVTNAIDESTQSIVEYQNALRQLKWDAFDKSMETVKRINSENDYYIDLMSHKDMTDKDTGNFTKYGTATIGLHKTNYDNYLAQADEYQREYNKIMRQIEKGELSLSDENVIQRLRDLQDAHRDAKKSAEDELQSIQDLVKQGYEAQTDALSELIDKYKKLKDSELEAYKYQKEIAEKTKTIASLQKQLTAYNGNDSEESRAQIQKLKVQLEEAKSDLKDTQYEKFISDTEDMLDDLMNDYQEFIDEKLNDTNTILDEIKTLLGSDIIETIKGLDSNLTNDTKDQIGSSTTNGGDGGQAAKDYVHNTVTNDQNKVNSKTDTSSYDPAKEADIAKKKNGIAQKKKAINGQRQSFQNQIKELESQLKQLYGELNSIENKYQFEKSSTKNKDKLQDLKNNYIEKKSGLNAMIQDVTHNKDMLQQFIADLDKQSAQLDKDLVSLKGYEKGSKHIDKRQLAWTQEDKREMIYRASDGAVLTKLNPGDKVFTNEMTENLWKMAQMNPAQMGITSQFTKLPDMSRNVSNSGNTTIQIGDIKMEGVNDVETFGRQLREEILRNGKTTQCITEAVSAKQLGKNGIGNARLYK